MMRGWNESGFGQAFEIARDLGCNSPEFKHAKVLNIRGLLFEKFTHKKRASVAEQFMQSRYEELMVNNTDDEDSEDSDGEEAQPHFTDLNAILAAVRLQTEHDESVVTLRLRSTH